MTAFQYLKLSRSQDRLPVDMPYYGDSPTFLRPHVLILP